MGMGETFLVLVVPCSLLVTHTVNRGGETRRGVGWGG